MLEAVARKSSPTIQTAKPQILFLAHRFPFPPDRGDRIRSWNILRYLSARANVSLACITESLVSRRDIEFVGSTCQRLAIAPVGPRWRWVQAGMYWMTGKSLSEGLFWSRSLSKTLDYWSDLVEFDQVFVYCSSMFPFAERKALRSIPCVVDLIDVDSQKWNDYAVHSSWVKRSIFRSEATRIRRLEHDCIARSKAVLLASEAEADLLRSQLPHRSASILGVSNGVDSEYFHPKHREKEKLSSPQPLDGKRTSELRLVFVGVLNYLPNVDGLRWFLEHVWPKLRQHLPTATIEIVGKDANTQAQKFASYPGVQLTGAVADVRPAIADADVVIAPLKIARGIQNKVLEAMAMAKPVVVTPQAAEGIDAVPDKHFVVADSVDEWLENLIALARSPEVCQEMGMAARELIEKEFNWSSCLEPLDALLGIRSSSAPHSHLADQKVE
ncbi:MAG: TIGR03087 family PEP-CTERM/XrtA system glycosyltransferase [Pirellula sp.]|jgi:sugar transferase (PEP-CTERM/EpsH1 system associated)